MRFSSAVLGAWLWAGAVTAMPADIHTVFTNPRNRWNVHTTVSFPNGPGFSNATMRWNSFDGPTYSVAVTPATGEDVANAVRIARSHNIPFLGTGGRHSSSTTLSKVHNGLAIDLSRLNTVHVNAKAGTLTVGGGTTFGQIIEPVYKAGYEMPVGSCSCPGMVGASIGGGVGRFQGIDGLIIDSLLSVRLVTAKGDLIDVSKNSHPDLFWGVRGAGQNFGIITSATYKLSRQVNKGQVLNADFTFPASKNGSYYDIIESFQHRMPAGLATITIIYYNEPAGEAQLLVNWVYIGAEDEGRRLIKPLLALNPITASISMVAYNKIYDTALQGLGNSICDLPISETGYGVNFRNLSSSTFQTVFQKMSDFYADHPDGRGSGVEMEVFAPQAVEAVAVGATAYPWRDTKGYSLISFQWNTTETQQAGYTKALEVRSDFVATSGYDGLSVYVSYGRGDETPKQIFGSNLPRLTQLKKKWDPDHVFRFFHDLPSK